MDRNLLKIINVISIPIVIIIMIVSRLNIFTGLLSLIASLAFFYFLILAYINVRGPVFDYVNSKIENNDIPVDTHNERVRKSIKYLLFIGVFTIGILWTILLLYFSRNNFIYGLYGLLFILISLLLSFYIDISYTLEYFASKRIRVNYMTLIMMVILSLILGAFVFLYMITQLVWYMIFITLAFLIIAAYYRTKKTIDFLKYVKNKPLNPGMEQGFKILYFTVFIAGIGAFLLGTYFRANIGSGLGFLTFIIQLMIVVYLTKAISDIS